jgi:hypothetical protein
MKIPFPGPKLEVFGGLLPQTTRCVDEMQMSTYIREAASFELSCMKIGRVVWFLEAFEKQR